MDGDLFVYDAVVLSALAAKGFIGPLPDSSIAGDVFPWVIDKSRFRRRVYGVPIMLCSNALICQAKDDRHAHNLMELNESVAIPMRSMIMYYWERAGWKM